MKIAVPKERRPHERRVAVSPDTVKKLKGLGFDVVVETGAGDGASQPDRVFAEAGATIAPDAASTYADADVIFKIQRPLRTGEGGVVGEMPTAGLPSAAVILPPDVPISKAVSDASHLPVFA